MFQSEIYGLWDTIQYDNGYDTDYHDVWTLSANTELARTSEGTTFTAVGTGANYIALNDGVNDANQVFLDSTQDFRLEFSTQVSNQIGMYFGTASNRNQLNLGYHNLNLNRWVVDVLNSQGKVYVYLNNAVNPNYTYNVDFGGALISFRIVDWQGDCNILLKDFKAYYI